MSIVNEIRCDYEGCETAISTDARKLLPSDWVWLEAYKSVPDAGGRRIKTVAVDLCPEHVATVTERLPELTETTSLLEWVKRKANEQD